MIASRLPLFIAFDTPRKIVVRYKFPGAARCAEDVTEMFVFRNRINFIRRYPFGSKGFRSIRCVYKRRSITSLEVRTPKSNPHRNYFLPGV